MKILFCVLSLITLTFSQPTRAAQRIVFHMGLYMEYVTIQQLEHFVAGGKPQGFLETLIRKSEFDEDAFRSLLGIGMELDLVQTSKMLRTAKGDRLLGIFAQCITPPRGGRMGKIAMRGAIVTSLVGDNELTIPEVIRNYPTEMWINLKTLEKMLKEILEETASN